MRLDWENKPGRDTLALNPGKEYLIRVFKGMEGITFKAKTYKL
jgi:hypothetical protein